MAEDPRADQSLPPEGQRPSAEPLSPAAAPSAETLGSATYEIIRQRLQTHGQALRERLSQLDARRREVFGSVDYKLLQADRINTAHNCVPRDMVQLGHGRFLFGFNVQFGLKQQVDLSDVFAVYSREGDGGSFKQVGLDALQDPGFLTDFKRLYNVYEKSALRKFSVIEGKLYMVFATGSGVNDIAVFKWAYNEGQLRYVDGRAEAEYRRVGFPPQYAFRWETPDRESYRYGDHPHISVEDRVFVECTEGDLTIKIEDNTATGHGIYAEPVDDKYQKVDDADIGYAVLGHLILLRIRPYKEPRTRYFIYNEKQQSVDRVDSLGQSCGLLPEEQGLIFPDGTYLATGELKRFECKERDLLVERVVHAPNGEDSLYVFYNRLTGDYVLMPYRLIAQKVEERLSCNGFTLFPDGHLVLFRAEQEPQKHHMIQIWQTPFHQPGLEPAGQREAVLYQVGNKDVVRCLSECNEVLTLLRKEDPYAELYTDVVKRCGAILDAFSWLGREEGFEADVALRQVRDAADQAVDEFDKVRRLRRDAVQRAAAVRARCEEQLQAVRRGSFKTLNDFVSHLAALRHLRGDLITLKDVRYVDVEQVDDTEQAVVHQTEELSHACVQFLLKPEALEPHRRQAQEQLRSVDSIAKVAEGKELEKAVAKTGGELEMLIEIVNSLKIEDATETTRIIDTITTVYSTLNQVKAALKQRLKDLVASEGAAQFAAQLKLLSQSAASYLDLCDAPAKCDDYLNRISVQLEELEGAFADFEEYTVQLAERRTELYEAFEQRKMALLEQRNRRATALMSAAERILKVIQNRLAGFKTIEDINTYMASDLMIAKVRETIDQLLNLEDSVKADDLQGRLKSAQQEAVRQLKDRQELFVDGQAIIRLGRHRFNTNTQPLDLTVVHRENTPFLHLTGTKYFDRITDEAFLATTDVWEQEVISENRDVYRAEYLAYRLLQSLTNGSNHDQRAKATTDGKPRQPTSPACEQHAGDAARRLSELSALPEAGLLARVQEFMGPRYQEGYVKGIHDLDGAKILHALVSAHLSLQLARYGPAARACAAVFWHRFCPADTATLWTAKLRGFARRNELFPGDPTQTAYVSALQTLLAEFIEHTRLYPESLTSAAGAYLFQELLAGNAFVVSREAQTLVAEFEKQLVSKGSESFFARARESLAQHPVSELELIRDWVRGFLLRQPESHPYLEEITAVLFCGDDFKRSVVEARTRQVLEALKGSHGRVDGGAYQFDYLEFQQRLQHFECEVVPRFTHFHDLKRRLMDQERTRLRLDEFKPRVLSSFVRNQLIDEVYLPLIGDNLAKQIGAAGDRKRTDLMGLLLLISPPGYGKTTLMEYIGNRLGVVFIKINGPALGHSVSSLDPEEAPNAAAREEVHKLNLALEMGDNTMIYVDDIQHCNPEFLQKFISLCDAQRKIEGVWRGQPRTYDLRGRKVVVVMAGNPYTESGQKFRIPDMLANRADTYNLGDIIGGSSEAFKASYLENAVTSNSTLAPLANKSQKDIRAFIHLAESGERDTDGFEGSYSSQEVEEILSVLQKLVSVREIILRVNLEYIRSAAQADEYRTEPPFKLQGSYRNMNRLAEKIVAIMNDDEVQALATDHYKSESQTLTTGAESNFLKFKELIGAQTEAEAARWADIRKTFKRNLLAHGGDASDPVGRVVAQLSIFQSGLEAIQQTLERQLAKAPTPPQVMVDLAPVEQGLAALQTALLSSVAKEIAPPQVVVELEPLGTHLEALRTTVEKGLGQTPAPAAPTQDAVASVAARVGTSLDALRGDLSRAISEVHTGSMAAKVGSLMHEMEMVHSTLATLKDIASRQRDYVRNVEEMLVARAKDGTVEIQLTQEMLQNEHAFLEQFQKVMSQQEQPPEATNNETPPPAGT